MDYTALPLDVFLGRPQKENDRPRRMNPPMMANLLRRAVIYVGGGHTVPIMSVLPTTT